MSEENPEIVVELDLDALSDLIPDDIQVSTEAKILLQKLVEREVGEVTSMLFETTAIQGKYTAQDIRQILSLKGFNICY